MSGLTIGAVAHLSGVRPSTLRYYERVGILPAPPREHGRRRYDRRSVEHVAAIKLAQRAGFTIAEIGELAEAVSEEVPLSPLWDRMARVKIGEIDEQIERLESSRRLLEEGMRCRCRDLSDCSLAGTAG